MQKFTATSFQLYPYVKQHGSRSDLTIVKPDLGQNYLQKFTSTSCQLYPYVKQYGSRSDLTTGKPDLGLNYLQKFTSTSCQTAWVEISYCHARSLCQTVKQHGSDLTSSLIWVCQTICKSSLFAKVHSNFLSVISLCQTAWVEIRPNNCHARSVSKLFAKVHLNLM